MPRKQTPEERISPAASKPESMRNEQPPARKRPARSVTAEDSGNVSPKSTTPSTLKAVGRSRKATQRGSAQLQANSQLVSGNDGFQEAVARLAYHFWEVRSSQNGSPEADWLRAEQAVREVLGKIPAKPR
jgi:hypothetical protein